jgi:hypothetical protein
MKMVLWVCGNKNLWPVHSESQAGDSYSHPQCVCLCVCVCVCVCVCEREREREREKELSMLFPGVQASGGRGGPC